MSSPPPPRLRAIIIGGGIGGLATAGLLAKKGYRVSLFEKNEQLGGRAFEFSAAGFRFDGGPSWYLMPDVFEQFFRLMGEKVEDHLELQQLAPSYRVFFKGTGKHYDFYSDLQRDLPTVEGIEPGAGKQLKEYLRLSKYQYDIAIQSFMYKNYNSITDFLNRETMVEGRKLKVFSKMDKYVSRFFHSDEMRKIMQYQLVFLGSSPYDTPALYNIMSHIDFNMGVFYPRGGIHTIPQALATMARQHGAELHVDTPVSRIIIDDGRAVGVATADGQKHAADLVISNGDIHHTETKLLPKPSRSFSERYWKSRTLAPSAFIMYLGVRGKVPSLTHHNLLFSDDWKRNFAEIFDSPQFPSDPSVYVCAPSVTEPSVAPAGHENLFVLVPMGSGVAYTEEQLSEYAKKTLATLEKELNIPDLRQRIVYQRLFCVKDFEERYHSLSGSALGLAHTMRQTAIFRPDTKNRKVPNLYYVGANTNPGIGMPICLISAELVYKRIHGIDTAAPLVSL